MRIKYRDKTFNLKVKKVSFLGKFIGLMFCTSRTDNLLFEFKKNIKISIHSLFVFFPFIALWLDDKNNVLEISLVKPFSFAQKSKFSSKKLVEIPLNKKNKKVIELLDDKEIFKYLPF